MSSQRNKHRHRGRCRPWAIKFGQKQKVQNHSEERRIRNSASTKTKQFSAWNLKLTRYNAYTEPPLKVGSWIQKHSGVASPGCTPIVIVPSRGLFRGIYFILLIRAPWYRVIFFYLPFAQLHVKSVTELQTARIIVDVSMSGWRKWEPNWSIKIWILEIGFKYSDFGRKYGAEYEKQKSVFSIRNTNYLLRLSLNGIIDDPKLFQAKDNSYYDLEIRFQIVSCIVFAPIWIQEFSDLERY